MDVAIIGAGYVGLVTGAGLAHLGHRVRIGEADAQRVDRLRNGMVPIFEDGLPALLAKAAERELISFHTSNKEAAADSRLVFLCLPTPEGEDGRADLRFINAVVDELANEVGANVIFVVKSTVPPGTVSALRKRLADVGSPARIVSHPEFLREGRAVEDFLEPDRIVIGAWEEEDANAVADLYAGLETRIVKTLPTSAEMIKYPN